MNIIDTLHNAMTPTVSTMVGILGIVLTISGIAIITHLFRSAMANHRPAVTRAAVTALPRSTNQEWVVVGTQRGATGSQPSIGR